jgi:hypothetical protein
VAKPDGIADATWREDSPPPGLGDLLAVLVWTAAVAAFFWDVVSLRKALFYFDITEINYAYRDFLAREIRLGRFSRWFPGLYCGLPLYSESQAGYLHPLKYLLYPWLKTWQALNLDTVLSVWLTGLGAFGWLRRHVGPRGALTGAAVFGLSGFVWAHLIHTSMNNAVTSVPFVIWATEWAWDRGRLAGVALGALALAFQVFAGHLQDTLLTAGALGLYALYRAATERGPMARLQALGVAAGVVGLGVAIAAVQWIPSKELLDRSPRAGGLTWDKLTYGSWHPELLPTLVVREAYGTRARDTDWMDGFYPYHEMNAYLGLTALALAVIGGAASRDRWIAFWIILAGVGGVLMLGRFTLLFDLANRIPVVGSSRIPVRFHLWVTLAVAALAAVGVDRIERAFRIRLRAASVLVALLVLASIPILLYVYAPVWTDPTRWTQPYHIARYHWLGRELTIALIRTVLVGTTAALTIVAATRTRSLRLRQTMCSLLPLLVMADLLGAHWFDVATVSPSYWTVPPLSARKLKADPSFIRVFGIADRHSGEPGYASEPVDFLSVRDTLAWSLPPVWGLASSSGETPIIPRRMLEYTDHALPNQGRFDIESVTHIVAGRRQALVLRQVEPPERAGTAAIHKNPGALPRARLMGRPYYAESEAAAVAALDRLGGAIRDRVVVEDPDRPLRPDATASGSARITVDDPEHVVVETDSSGPAYLTLSDTYDPGWRAEVDGRPAPVRPAWVAFRAVYVSEGRHRVVFRYRPAGFLTGLAITLAGLAIAALLVAWPRRLASLRPAHDEMAWPATWPRWVVAAIVVLIAVSAVRFDREGRVTVSPRWSGSFHRFTWGAGIEAMRESPGVRP